MDHVHLQTASQGLNFNAWLLWNLNRKISAGGGLTLWWLWRWRNDQIFNNHELGLMPRIQHITKAMLEVNSTFVNQHLVCSRSSISSTVWAGWIPPRRG